MKTQTTNKTAINYYPFGSVMSERTWTAGSGYRYGFNGMEGVDEFSVEDGNYDFGARMYDARLGRFLSLDNYFRQFTSESNYIIAGNSPISYFDKDGDFKVPAEYKTKYPYFYNLVTNMVQNYFLQSEKIKNVLFKYTVGALTEDKIKEDTDQDSGPNIRILDWSKSEGLYASALGHFKSPNTIEFSEEYIHMFENILSNENAAEEAKLGVTMMIYATLINEYTHYGDFLDGLDAIELNGEIVNSDIPENAIEKPYDEGDHAAKAVFEYVALTPEKREIVDAGLKNYYLYGEGKRQDTKGKFVIDPEASEQIDESLIPNYTIEK